MITSTNNNIKKTINSTICEKDIRYIVNFTALDLQKKPCIEYNKTLSIIDPNSGKEIKIHFHKIKIEKNEFEKNYNIELDFTPLTDPVLAVIIACAIGGTAVLGTGALLFHEAGKATESVGGQGLLLGITFILFIAGYYYIKN